jgi:hypothetical protein
MTVIVLKTFAWLAFAVGMALALISLNYAITEGVSTAFWSAAIWFAIGTAVWFGLLKASLNKEGKS